MAPSRESTLRTSVQDFSRLPRRTVWKTPVASTALQAAVAPCTPHGHADPTRPPLRRPIQTVHHSDQGCQYTSLAFGRRCREAGISPSMGSVGDCFDNSMAESFFATLECELLDRQASLPQPHRRQARRLRLHRGLLQHHPPALEPWQREPCSLRGRRPGSLTVTEPSNLSVRPGQLHGRTEEPAARSTPARPGPPRA